MSKLVITVEVNLTEEETDIFHPNRSSSIEPGTSSLMWNIDAQADFVKDELRNPINKIDWKLRR